MNGSNFSKRIDELREEVPDLTKSSPDLAGRLSKILDELDGFAELLDPERNPGFQSPHLFADDERLEREFREEGCRDVF